MNIATMLKDILEALFTKPATKPYPNLTPDQPERLRGKLHYNPANCTGCQLCVKDCPAMAIELIEIDKQNKQFVMRYDVGCCTFCAQCVQNCRFDCLSMSNDEWSFATDEKTNLITYYGEEANLQKLLAENTDTPSEDAPS